MPNVYYNCSITEQLGMQGAGNLTMGGVFVFVMVYFCVSFIGVAIKQFQDMPTQNTGLIKQINLMRRHREAYQKEFPDAKVRVVAPDDYVTGEILGQDLQFTTANEMRYPTVSEYSASTTRGFALLSTVLATAAMSLPFMQIINLAIEQNHRASRFVTFIGYLGPLLTGIVMSSPTPEASGRTWNILCCFAIPLKYECCGSERKNPILYLHPFGISLFVVLPTAVNISRLGTDNFSQWGFTLAGTIITILGGIVYGVAEAGRLTKWSEPPAAGHAGKFGFLAEVIVVFTCLMTYVHREMIGTAWCLGGRKAEWVLFAILVIAAILPIVLSVSFFNRKLCFCCQSCTAEDEEPMIGTEHMYSIIVEEPGKPAWFHLFDADKEVSMGQATMLNSKVWNKVSAGGVRFQARPVLSNKPTAETAEETTQPKGDRDADA